MQIGNSLDFGATQVAYIGFACHSLEYDFILQDRP